MASLDVESVRRDFPILSHCMRGQPLVYLDSASSAQKPRAVLDAMDELYTQGYANVHRGLYELAEWATSHYEGVRDKVARFIGAADPREIVFVRNVTEGINLVAHSFVRERLGSGDEILISAMEHHANIVPWQILCEQAGAQLRVAPIDDRGEILVEEFEKLLSPRTRLVALAHVSNVLGTVNPIRELIALAREREIPILIDGAQGVPHLPVDVQELGCDFYSFTGHKLFGPTGVGVIWGRLPLLDAMPPYQSGGDMIESVRFEKTTFAPPPHKFEAGTPNIAGVIGLGAAIDYVNGLGIRNIAAWEHGLLEYATEALESIGKLRIYGKAKNKAAVLSFALDGVHPHDIGTVLDQEGVAIRAGHHCAQPLMERFGVSAMARASLSIYNTRDDVDRLVRALHKTLELFG
ncbi:MAG: cysteine desulfurase [Proteobacteria bacterium]|nr:cysteine desulfurase [Pseudomonadota bacterium]